MLVVAHRGNSSVAPENTLAAFEAACRAGADAIELDVRRTSDGVDVVLHDRDVASTTDGRGPVDDLAVDQLGALDAGARFGAAYAGQRVPLLAEALALVAEHPGVGLMVELKGVWTAEDAAPVARALEAVDLAGRSLVKSFRRRTVAAVRDAAPELDRGLLVELWTPDVLHACESLGVRACNPALRILHRRPGVVGRLHDAGLETYPWTLDDPEDWELATSLGVDGIITNRPDRLRGWLEGRASAEAPDVSARASA